MLQLQIIIIPAVTLALLLGGGVLLFAYFKVRKDSGRWKLINQKDWSHEGLSVSGWGLVGTGAFMLLVTIVALFPYNPSYWLLTQDGGEVANISNRFVDGTGDVSGATYTLTLDGDLTPRIVTDSRVLGLSVGDRVDLTCSLEWVYGGADKSNCYIRSF